MDEQNLKNHGWYVPLYHFFTLPILVGNFGARVYFWIRAGFCAVPFFFHITSRGTFSRRSLRTGVCAVGAESLDPTGRTAALRTGFAARTALGADELTVNQFVSLRFASDDELPALMKKVLDGKLTSRKAIKRRLIKNWRPDYLRS